jgi:hypothetical protein
VRNHERHSDRVCECVSERVREPNLNHTGVHLIKLAHRSSKMLPSNVGWVRYRNGI